MTGPTEARRKARTIMATDSEWARIRERADAEDMPISRYVVLHLLSTSESQPPPQLPLEVQWRIARDVSVLSRIEKHRFERAGEEEAWQTICEAAEALLEADEAQG